jgi:hypothetical protein
LQQRLAVRAAPAHAEEIFRRRIQVFDEKALVDDDDGCVQVLEDELA